MLLTHTHTQTVTALGIIIVRSSEKTVVFRLVIHAYNYLRSKIEVEDKFDNTEIKMPKAEKLEQNELPLSPAPETHDLELTAATSGGAKTPESNGDRSSPTVAATQATLSAQANLNAANMALAIFKNAPKPRISSPINNSNNRSSKDDVETISITDDSDQQLKTERLDNSDKDNQITSSGFSMNLGPVNQGTLLNLLLRYLFSVICVFHSSGTIKNDFYEANNVLKLFFESTGTTPTGVQLD